MTEATTSVVSIRVSPDERALLVAASDHARTTLSDFMRRKALEAAEVEMLERRSVVIPAERWEAFEAWVNAPAKANRALRDLARRRPTWDR